MSPASAPLRLLPLQDRDAKFLYRWLIQISLIAGAGVIGLAIGFGAQTLVYELNYPSRGSKEVWLVKRIDLTSLEYQLY